MQKFYDNCSSRKKYLKNATANAIVTCKYHGLYHHD